MKPSPHSILMPSEWLCLGAHCKFGDLNCSILSVGRVSQLLEVDHFYLTATATARSVSLIHPGRKELKGSLLLALSCAPNEEQSLGQILTRP